MIVRTADDQQVLELAIVENIQREDLNPIELAIAFQRMATELGLSHDQIGQKTGKERTTITNSRPAAPTAGGTSGYDRRRSNSPPATRGRC